MIFASAKPPVRERVRQEMRARLEQSPPPEAVERFLLDHWVLLLCEIQQSVGEEHADWQAGWDTVDALVWSLAPKRNRLDTERLLNILPILLGRLQEGCQAMGMSSTDTEAFFSLLAKLHAGLARAGLRTGAEGGAAGSGPDATGEYDVPPALQSDAERQLERLRVDDWVVFHTPDGERRLRLQWISASRGMFLFADSQGLDTLSLTRARLLERFEGDEVALDGESA